MMDGSPSMGEGGAYATTSRERGGELPPTVLFKSVDVFLQSTEKGDIVMVGYKKAADKK